MACIADEVIERIKVEVSLVRLVEGQSYTLVKRESFSFVKKNSRSPAQKCAGFFVLMKSIGNQPSTA
jgi:hypothetical protein